MRAVSLIPLWACLIGQRIIGDASPDVVGMGGHPLSFNNIGADSTTPLGTLLGFLVLDMLLYALLGIYLDMTLPVGPGVKQPWLFFTSAPSGPRRRRPTCTPSRCLPPRARRPR